MSQQKKTFDGGRALLIGIGEGYCPSLQLSRMVRQDAEAVGRVLRDPEICGYPSAQVRLLLDEEFHFIFSTAYNALERSSIRSSACSRPAEKRMKPSLMPSSARASGGNR